MRKTALRTVRNPVARDGGPLLRCVRCGSGGLSGEGREALACERCGHRYGRRHGVVCFLPAEEAREGEAVKGRMQAFWGGGYEKLYSKLDSALGRRDFERALDELTHYLRWRRHLAVVEMDLGALRGQSVLDLGCGAGTHAALFARHGARVTAVDLAPNRAAAAARKFSALGARGWAFQADAENLPFADGQFDVVFSNGVIHHTPNTPGAVDEIWRVLRPGGRAAVMVYGSRSAQYWLTCVLLEGVLRGKLLAGGPANWLGGITELTQKTAGGGMNPMTRYYSPAQARRLFGRFEGVRVRKDSFRWDDDPFVMGPLFRRLRPHIRIALLERRSCEATRLLYGVLDLGYSPLELALGRILGYGLIIDARKPVS